jgi:hypothetical protein
MKTLTPQFSINILNKNAVSALFMILISTFGGSSILAQAPWIEWQKSLGGSNTDVAEYVQQTIDGGYIVAGYSSSNDGDASGNHGSSDFWVVKLTPTGTLEWQKSHGGSNVDIATSLQQTLDGGYIVAGASKSSDGDVIFNRGGFDFWIMKLDEAGNFDGQTSHGGSGDDIAYSIQQTFDGGYILAGESNSTDWDVTGNHGGFDYWVVKISDQGSIQWQNSLGGSGNDRANSIIQTTDGGYIVTGYSNSTDGDVSGNHGGVDFWVVKLNNQGVIEWQKSLGGSNSDAAYNIQQTEDGGYVVAGLSSSNDGDVSENQGGEDFWVVKLDSSGGIEWQKSFGGSEMDRANSISQTVDGGYIVVGVSMSEDGDITENYGGQDYWAIKLNAFGVLQWQKSLGGSEIDRANSINQTTDGGYIVAGQSNSNDGNVTGNHGSNDFWIVKLEPDPLGIDDFNGEISVYPNPVSNFLNISTTEPILSISVFNVLGQKMMESLPNQTSVKLDMSSLPTNLYFVAVKTERGSETFKIMVR